MSRESGQMICFLSASIALLAFKIVVVVVVVVIVFVFAHDSLSFLQIIIRNMVSSMI